MTGALQMLLSGGPSAPAVGEYMINNGYLPWMVPAGVTSVCVVCVGNGGAGIQFGGIVYGGGGGGLAYKNNITVTPGDSILLGVDLYADRVNFGSVVAAYNGQTGSASPTSGGTGTGGDVNNTGGAGSGGFGGSWPGGSAANYTGNGANGGGQGIGLTGTGSSGDYGRGGASIYSGTGETGGAGAVRVIWGAGRSFPSNAA